MRKVTILKRGVPQRSCHPCKQSFLYNYKHHCESSTTAAWGYARSSALTMSELHQHISQYNTPIDPRIQRPKKPWSQLALDGQNFTLASISKKGKTAGRSSEGGGSARGCNKVRRMSTWLYSVVGASTIPRREQHRQVLLTYSAMKKCNIYLICNAASALLLTIHKNLMRSLNFQKRQR